jgi:hydrogenase maturation protein HypF
MERRTILVHGLVQGVGFRPFVYNLAVGLGLVGSVRNQTGVVRIEVEGDSEELDRFLAELSDRPPPLAQIQSLTWEEQPLRGDREFRIESSSSQGQGQIVISPDVATCPECLAELFDPADRRFGYPFLNCTNCGPRLTIITGAPYDRQRTTMAKFAMCDACRAEYDDPADRRFHAQPTACADCGPRLRVLDASGREVRTEEPLELFSEAIRAGGIGALKGLGGYHLACDARNPGAVAELRRRKHRDEKPLAVMVANEEAAAALCEINAAERALLASPRRPIVLLRERSPGIVAPEVAPGNPWLGVMLPYTPLHHLLLRAVGGIPLIMTSGNRSDEPIAYEDDDAVDRLGGIADLFLVHDRGIHVRCDDSVSRVVDGVELPVRRSRGYAPQPMTLPLECPLPILAVGGQLKATFALGSENQAFLGHHMGDLDHYEAYKAFRKDVELYQQLFGITPECLAHDLHPDYATTRYAEKIADRSGTRLLGVQHHHAHLASCMAEHGLAGPVIGVTFDGTGFGTDGNVWGGEFLVGDYRAFRRAAHLRYVGMPGGEKAIREPWRMAVSHMLDADVKLSEMKERVLPTELALVMRMLERGVNTPLTSSAGRLFDAVAAIAGVRDRVSYEGQAAMELEWLAESVTVDGGYPFDLVSFPAEHTPELTLVVDTRPLIRAVAEDALKGSSAALIARRFHTTMIELVASVCDRLRASSGVVDVVLSGGVFLNALLTHEVCQRLSSEGFRVYRHRLVPPGDGGLSLGQLAVAASRVV